MIDRHVPRPRDLRPLMADRPPVGPRGPSRFGFGWFPRPGGRSCRARPLYEAVVRDLPGPLVERPSYAQIVAWTCQDHPGEVHAELQRKVATEARAPRARRIAADSVPLTPRFLAAGLALVDAIITGVAGTTGRSPAQAR